MSNYLKTLEFDKILNKVKYYAVSTEAKEIILNLKPYKDLESINLALKETDDAYTFLRYNQNPNFNNFPYLANAFLRLEKESSLNQKELLDIKHLLDITDNAINFKDKSNKSTTLDKYFDKLMPLKNENINISTKILSETEVASSASTSLQDLRRKKNILKDRINLTSERLLNKYKNYLQEPIISNKNGKSCLQIKSEFKSYVKGTVLDISTTGLSIYIEPQELIEINNEISNIEVKEKIEIDKILYDISISLSKHLTELKTNYENLIQLDFIFAKALYAQHEHHTLPTITNDKNIELINCKHPLIDKDKVVPLDVTIEPSCYSLIITGPNTGGKTVFLKTIGLIELMSLSGLFIPCLDNSKVAFFDNIFADIGDEQSIEQSLSTFSSHMTNIIDILKYATKNSLCLFDELATGTDPVEGANLAISILNDLKDRQIKVIATTHYPELKLYAMSENNVKNGSFEFDIDTLKPTYRLLLGIPGKSNAFAISKRLGLSEKIINNAKSLINSNDEKFEDIISNLHRDKILIEKEKQEIKQLKEEADELKNKVIRQQKGLNDRTDSEIRRAKEEARKILLNAKKLADDALREIKTASNKDIESKRTLINSEIKNINNDMIEKVKGPSKPLSSKKIRIGSKVKILSMNSIGNVETLPDKDYNLFVRVGILRINVNLRDLELINDDNINIEVENLTIKKSQNSTKIKIEKSNAVESSINIIGMNTDEATIVVDKYLDDCVLSHLPFARIIHGRGSGALKKAVHELLRKSPLVKDFRLGQFGEGQDGVTIVNFE